MTHQNTEFTDAEIHAYVDGQLDETRAKYFLTRMKTDHQLARTVRDYQLINANLRAMLDPVVREPVPKPLLAASIDPTQTILPRNNWLSLAQAAVIAVLMIASGLMGWMLKGNDAQTTLVQLRTNLIHPATFAHSVYASDTRRPVEITAENEEELIRWLSRRLKTDIKAPNLKPEGFQLLGGRLIPSTNRMAAQFMYENNAGERVSLYVRRGVWGKINMPLHYDEDNGLAAFTWINNSMGYALSGSLHKKELLALAETAHLN